MILNGQKGRLSAPRKMLKSMVFLQLVDNAANQQSVCILSMQIWSSNNYTTKDQTLSNQAKQSWHSRFKTKPVAAH